MYTNPKDGGNRPMKSIPQQSNISISRMRFKGIMFRLVIDPNFLQFLQVLQNSYVYLNMVGQ